MKKILGFDISSTCIGYCHLEIDEDNSKIKFISCDYIKPIKKGNIIERLSHTRDKIILILEKVQPDIIAIEDIIQFMSGASTAKTIITLTSFNRMIGLLCHDYLSKSPEMYSVMSIRHGLKLNKILPKKEDMPELVSKHLGIKFPYEKNKNGKIKPESYDMADGVSVALYSAMLLTNKIKKKK
jgi:hypothetical protein